MNGPMVTVGIPTYNRAHLLREAIDSVLAQSYRDFTLLVSDNASTDETSEVVESFADPRIRYVRAQENIGMVANFNRLVELAETELIMLLPDDDMLYPGYLGAVVDVLQRYPAVGVAHTAFDEIDIESRVRKRAVSFVSSKHARLLEPGQAYLERSMTSIAICFSTATFRTSAIREAGGQRPEEEPFADVPLFMRIALKWDFAYLDSALVGFRTHEETETKRLASKDGQELDARDRLLTYARIFFDRRMGFLEGAKLPSRLRRRYRSLATLRFLADRGGLGASWMETTSGLWSVVRLYPAILAHPLAWRLVAAQLGGRRLRRATGRLTGAIVRSRSTWAAQRRRRRGG